MTPSPLKRDLIKDSFITSLKVDDWKMSLIRKKASPDRILVSVMVVYSAIAFGNSLFALN